MRSKAVKAVVIGIVVALLGVPPVHGQSDPGPSAPEADRAEPPVSDGSQEDAGSALTCRELYAQVEWDESEFIELLDCLFDLPELVERGRQLQNEESGVSGTQSSGRECGEVSVEYIVQQYFPLDRYLFNFIRIGTDHFTIYLMYLTCEDGSPAVGYSTALQQTWGPDARRNSDFCWVSSSRGTVEQKSVADANGCPSYIGGIPGVAVSAHLHYISGPNDDRIRQVVMWADLNRNSQHDIGEPYDTAYSPDALNFEGFSPHRISDQSVGRPGQLAALDLRLTNRRGHLLRNKSVGAIVVSGPSAGAVVSCYKPVARISSASDRNYCATDEEGRIRFEYLVGTRDLSPTRQDVDVFQVYLDENKDGQRNRSEPFQYETMRIAKSATYVALGDSYSSGENGREDDPLFDFEGSYLSVNPADSDCRRWNMAYPLLMNDLLAGTDINVTTYACTGAVTANIYYNPNEEDEDEEDEDEEDEEKNTNRPSVMAAAETSDAAWEPRQIVSLAGTNHVDMVTVTIGGNDAGFEDTLRACFSGGCGERDLTETKLAEVKDDVESVLSQLKIAAPEAAIFILEYPYITPESLSCRGLTIDPILDSLRNDLEPWEPGSFYDKTVAIVGEVARATTPLVLQRSLRLGALQAILSHEYSNTIATVTNLFFEYGINNKEAKFLRDAAELLNERIRRAARATGVHYVPVAGEFDGHSTCARGANNDWIYGLNAHSIPGETTNRTIFDLIGAAWGGSDSITKFITPSISRRSFHPNADGHKAYARILREFIETAVSSGGVELNESGLPVNPVPQPVGASIDSSSDRATASSASDGLANLDRISGLVDSSEETDSVEDDSIEMTLLTHRRMIAAESDCNASLLVSGDRLELSAEGFEPNSVVRLAAAGTAVSTPTTASATPPPLTVMALPSVTADAEGRIKTVWAVPDISDSQGSVPRLYLMMAGGADPAGDELAAVMLIPIVAYPGTKPCARDDSATTSLGRSVRIPVLANDIAPQGGTLNRASVQVDPVYGGEFSLNASDGSLTFSPAPGFAGTVATGYQVHDNWGAKVRANISVTVNAGCTITGVAGTVDIAGTEGNDVICVPDPSDPLAFHIIDAKGGDDVILGGDGVDWVYGGPGRDVVYGRYGKDLIDGGAGVDTIHGGGGFDSIYSTDLNDIIMDDDGGYEFILAPAAVTKDARPTVMDDWQHSNVSETVTVHVLDNDYDSNEDFDLSKLEVTRQPAFGSARIVTSDEYGAAIEYTASAVDSSDEFSYKICDLFDRCATAKVSLTVGDATCTIVGTDASDTLFGTSGNDVICGLGGNDAIFGRGGNDIIIGGDGNDTLNGGDGDDALWGGVGDDRLLGGTGSDTLWGGDGDDTLDGNTQDDTLNGGPGDDRLYGGGHNDTLYAGAGIDELNGNAGNDILHGGYGDDTINGGNGDDVLWGGVGDDRLLGGTGSDTLWGGDGDDMLDGNTQDDTLNGGPGDDRLYGSGHNDELHGHTGDDELYGGPGNDTVYGGWGEDTIDGGNGRDYLNGGSDTDSCLRGETVARC